MEDEFKSETSIQIDPSDFLFRLYFRRSQLPTHIN